MLMHERLPILQHHAFQGTVKIIIYLIDGIN